jgi:hypothetical protein
MATEETAVLKRRGKWSQSRVPHKGWRSVDIDDRGASGDICQMCESQAIRFVHFMEHDDYPAILEVVCVRGTWSKTSKVRDGAIEQWRAAPENVLVGSNVSGECQKRGTSGFERTDIA